MDDIKLPAWIKSSPTLAMASVLSQLLLEESAAANKDRSRVSDPVSGDRELVRFDVEGSYGADARANRPPRRGGGDEMGGAAGGGSSDDGDDDSASDQYGDEGVAGYNGSKNDSRDNAAGAAAARAGSAVDTGYLRMVDRLMDLNSKALDSLQPSSTAGSRTTLVSGSAAAGSSNSGKAAAVPPLPLAPAPLTSAMNGAFARRSGSFGAVQEKTPSVDLLHDHRVRSLLRLSRLNDILTRAESTPLVISHRIAAAMISFFAFAVACRCNCLPVTRTKGFFTECSSLYMTLLGKLHTLHFASGVSVEDFTAALVACGLKLRDDDEANGDDDAEAGNDRTSQRTSEAAGPARTSPTSAPMPPLATREKNWGLVGFGYRALDPAFVHLIPADIDVCVFDPVALGVLRGVALTYSQQLSYLGPDLVTHMHDLTDAFATSSHRRELPYKRVLSYLLEAISCSLVVDYERTNNWITAIIQETYVVRGLFQREVLHAHVVSATLTLLIRQYQEMAKECAARAVDLGAMPDFTEGDQLMELVWKALHDMIGSWQEAAATAEKHSLVLYRHNIEIVVQHLLRTEVERLRCYYIITSATAAAQASLVAAAPLSMSTTQLNPHTPNSVDIPLAASTHSPAKQQQYGAPSDEDNDENENESENGGAAEANGGAATSATKAIPRQKKASPYIPSPEEEALRILVCSNIIKFLLLPTSVMSALPTTDDANELRSSLTESAARVLSVVTAIEFNSTNIAKGKRKVAVTHPFSRSNTLAVVGPAMDDDTAAALTITRQHARFSINFYRHIERILHELIQTVLQQSDDPSVVAQSFTVPWMSPPASPVRPASPGLPRSSAALPAGDPAEASTSDAMMRGMVAAVCMQHLCSTNRHLRSFAVSEVMDAVVRISARRTADENGVLSATPSPTSSPADPEEVRKQTEQRRARRLALCFDAMSSIIVPTSAYVDGAYAEEMEAGRDRAFGLSQGGGSSSKGGNGANNTDDLRRRRAMSKREELSRYGQLLCDTYVDSLREYLARAAPRREGNDAAKAKVPTPVMSVAVKAFVNLVLRVHERLRGMSRIAFTLSQAAEVVDGAAAGGVGIDVIPRAAARLNKEKARLLRAFNAERMSVALLLRGAIQCMLSVAWPSSGVLYQNPLDGKLKPLDGTTASAAMAPVAFTAVAPFLRPLAMLMHLSTLFPAHSLQQLCTHHHYARYLTLEDPSTSDQYVYFYYRRLSRANIATGAANVTTPEEHMEQECWTLFRSCWMMFSHYKFTTEALIAACDTTTAASSSNNGSAATLAATLERPPVLSSGQCKLLRLIAASAAPLLRMCSSDVQQSMADIAVLMRYADESGEFLHLRRSQVASIDVTAATSGYIHHRLGKHLRHLCGGIKDKWGGLTTGELMLLQSIAELEILRAAAGSVAQLTLYRHFEVREFVGSPTIPVALNCIFHTACDQYISTVKRMLPTVAYQVTRTDLTQLVFLLSFAMRSVRESASKLALRIVESFPTYAAYASALPLLWCVLDLLDTSSAAQIETFCNYVHFAEVPAVAADPHSSERQQHIVFVSQVASQWASQVQEIAPQALFETAVKFMVIQQQECGEQAAAQAGGRQAGSRLAVLASQQHDGYHDTSSTTVPGWTVIDSNTLPVVRGARAAGRVVSPNYAQSLVLHGRAQGTLQAAGWFASVGQVEATVTAQLMAATRLSRRAFITAVAQRLESALLRPARALFVESGYAVSAVLPGAANGTAAEGDGEKNTNEEAAVEPVRVLARGAASTTAAAERAETATSFAPAVALLVLGNGSLTGRRQLLQYLVQGPVQTFRSDVLYDAILCWKWLLSQDREAYLLPLLQEVDTAFVWTAANRLGLFDGYHTSKNKLVQTGEIPIHNDAAGDAPNAASGGALYAESEITASPHKLLLSFLADMYVLEDNPLCLSAEVLRQLYLVAAHIMQFSPMFSLRDEMFGETMRCLLVVGNVACVLREANMRRLRAGLVTVVPFSVIGALRQRWYMALLRWFTKTPPSWYYAKDLVLAAEEQSVVRSLAQLLKEEKDLVSRATLGFLDFSSGVRPEQRMFIVHHWESLSVVRASVAAARHGEGNGEGNVEASLRKIIAKEQTRLQGLLTLLHVLVQHEVLRMDIWRSPRRTLKIADTTPTGGWERLVECADHHNPAVVVALVYRFASIKEVRVAAAQRVVEHPERYSNIPEAADLYLTEDVLEKGAPRLFLFHSCTIIQALRLLDHRYAKYHNVTSYAIRSLLSQRSEQLIFYLPQLLQLLATDKSGSIQSFLLRMSAKSTMFAHQLLWSLQTEGEGSNTLAKKCQFLEKKVKEAFTPAQLAFYTAEFDFVHVVTSLSGELMKFDKPQRKPNLRLRLKDSAFHTPPATHHLYLPTDSDYRVTDVIPHTAGAMQSAAKCPILVQFACVKRTSEDMRTPEELEAADKVAHANGGATSPAHAPSPVVKACIFKMGDDCRQDQISLQLIGLMQRILCSVGVPSYLYPYRVVTTGQDSGIIECVPHSMSRNEIGKLVESNLAEYFVQTFGHPESVSFRRARENFVKSTAAYSVVSFILNIKDRHNGNIMIDASGNLVHIDFGFLFDTSPGGDMNFESSPFKLTTEMVQLIGMDVGDDAKLHSKSLTHALVDKENYIYFKTLVNRCYLAVRQYAREICVLVELMLHSGLPCFKPKQTIHDLAKRLAIDKNEVEAANFMRHRVHEARQNYRTVLYDYYQKVAEGIEM